MAEGASESPKADDDATAEETGKSLKLKLAEETGTSLKLKMADEAGKGAVVEASGKLVTVDGLTVIGLPELEG